MKTNLSDGDVAGLLRIAGEVGELEHDVQLRRTHILAGLLGLVGGCGAVCVEMDPNHVEDTGWALPDTITLAGMFTRHKAMISEYLTGRLAALDPCTPHLLRRGG